VIDLFLVPSQLSVEYAQAGCFIDCASYIQKQASEPVSRTSQR
jgi:hypothetical protein